MKYLLIQIFILVVALMVLYYFSTLPNFLPFLRSKEPDWGRISMVLTVLYFLLQSTITIVIYLVQKFLAYGWKEFPPKGLSLKWGIGLAIGLTAVILLHLLHIVSFTWGLVVMLALTAIIMML